MKKLLLLLLVLPFVLSSCGSDDDEGYSEAYLIGKWEWIASEGWYYEDGKKITFSESYINADEPSYAIFNKDGSGVSQETYSSGSTYNTEFTWSLKGDELTITTRSGKETSKIISLNSTTLVVVSSGTDQDGEYNYKDTFRKVN